MPKKAKKRTRVEGMMYRAADGVAVIDEEKRLVRVSFSSEREVKRVPFFGKPWIEILGHKTAEVNLGRLNGGATVHYNHSRSREDRIGVVESAKIKGKRGEAVIRISQRDSVSDDIWPDLRDNLLQNVSVGYAIHERELIKSSEEIDVYRVTDWEPMELSLVDIPADPSVGVGRSQDELITRALLSDDFVYDVISLDESVSPNGARSMPPKELTEAERKAADDAANLLTKDAADEAARAALAAADEAAGKRKLDDEERETIRKGAVDIETARRSDIEEVFTNNPGHEVLRTECLADADCTGMSAYRQICKAGANGGAPSGHITIEHDRQDKFRGGVAEALLTRSGYFKDKPPKDFRENPWRGSTLLMIARDSLHMAGSKADGLSKKELIGRAFTSSDDFTNLLADIANKSLLQGYEESPETWMAWARAGNLSDFKVARRVGLSSFQDLLLVNEGAEYTYGDFTDRGETIQLGSYGRLFSITRQTIINDDLNALTRIPFGMGRAAARVPGDLAYAVLTVNGNLSDGVALFAAGHNNIGTTGVISVTTVGEARNLMALQSDVSGSANGLNIVLAVLLVPVQIRDVGQVLATSEFDPDGAHSRIPNPVRGDFQVISDPRLSAASTVIWYAVADGNIFDTVEVGFLDGIQEPTIEEKTGWTVSGVEFKITLDVAAAALDSRTMVRNAGV